jgi:hypothetical protein
MTTSVYELGGDLDPRQSPSTSVYELGGPCVGSGSSAVTRRVQRAAPEPTCRHRCVRIPIPLCAIYQFQFTVRPGSTFESHYKVQIKVNAIII